jgi:Icc-related predicted phosphoesterase
MRIIFATDLHGPEWKYNRLFKVAADSKANIVINGGDMLPKNGDLSQQKDFIASFLDGHFNKFNDAGIYYLCYPGATTQRYAHHCPESLRSSMEILTKYYNSTTVESNAGGEPLHASV